MSPSRWNMIRVRIRNHWQMYEFFVKLTNTKFSSLDKEPARKYEFFHSGGEYPSEGRWLIQVFTP